MVTASYLLRYFRKYASLALVVSFWISGVSSSGHLFGLGGTKRASANVQTPLNSSSTDSVSLRSTYEPPPPLEQSPAPVAQLLGKLPIRFEANRGQTDPQVKFIARGGGGRFFLTPRESVFVLRRATPRDRVNHDDRRGTERGAVTEVIRMRLLGGNVQPEVIGESETPAKSNYFIGNDKQKWLTDVPTYSQVRYKDALPGIDMVYHGNERQLEYDFEIAPGADPYSIKLGFTGVLKIKVTADGELDLRTRRGEFRQRRPHAFQEIDGQRVNVPCSYFVRGREIGFRLGDYDKSKLLVIDPMLVFSTYLGGSGEDRAYDITLDNSRNIYITGETVSTDFPTANQYETFNGGTCSGNYPCSDVFVTKMHQSGQSIIFSTYVGGTGKESGLGIAIDSKENVYVVGQTASSNFPALGGGVYKAAKTLFAYLDAFMFKLSAEGNSIPYGTYINGNGSGGSANTSAYAVALDSQNKVWVAGTTGSNDFPTTADAYKSTSCQAWVDKGFLLKLDPDPECKDTRTPACPVADYTPTDPPDLLYSTYVCSSGGSAVMDMALDPAGNVWLAGEARNNFPTTLDAFQPNFSDPGDVNERDGFAAKISASGTLMLYATYLGGTNIDKAWGVATDGAGNAYVAGSTFSSDFPTTPGAFDTTVSGQNDAFVVKFLGTGLAAYSTVLGGGNIDTAYAIAADASGHAYVTGNAVSSNFPITTNAQQPTSGGGGNGDSFLTKLSADGSSLDLSTYLGGSSSDYGEAISLDSAGNAYVAGHTSSTNFPTTTGAYDTTFGGGTTYVFDAFVSKLSTENFVISGRVTDSANLGFSGVTISLSGSRTATTLTDVSGNYSFEVPSKGNYTVAASRSGFTFTPGPTTFNNLLEDKPAYFSTTAAQPIPTTRPQPLLADALVQDLGGSSSANYGTAPELLTQVKVTVGMNRESYLKFDVGNFDSAAAVKLRLFGKLSVAGSGVPTSVFSVANTTWDETTITWNGKPSSGPTALATTTVSSTVAGWFEWDVTSYVNAERAAGRTVVSFVLKNDTGSAPVTRFNSREAGENTPRLEVTTPSVSGALPSPWVAQDIGTGMTAGSATHLSGAFTVRGAGTGIIANSTSDSFHLVHQQISGDFKFSARVSSLENIGPTPRAGVTIRASLATDAPHASLLLKPGNSAELFTRPTTGAVNTLSGASAGEWVMLMRRGTDLSGYTSFDGVNWYQAAGAVTFVGLTDPVFIGLVATSGNTTDLLKATFNNVTITTGTPNPPPQVGMSYPAMGATFNPGTNIPLSATAYDVSGGTISQVEFLAGTTVVGTTTTPTSGSNYTVTWNNVAAGIYSIQARATDNGGDVTTSSPVTISVNPAGAVTLNPTDDAYVQDGANAANNFGTSTIMYVQTGTPGSADNFDSYLKLDTTTVSSVTHATLRVYCYTTSAQAMTVYAVSDTTWTETGITWNNKPTLGAALRTISVAAASNYKFHDLDVTDYVQSEKAAGRHVITLALHAPAVASGRINVTARETTFGGIPELLVTTNTYKGRIATGPGNDDQPRYMEIASRAAGPDVSTRALVQSPFGLNTERPALFSGAAVGLSGWQTIPGDTRFVPDELLIQYEDGVSENEKSRARDSIRAVMKEKIKSPTRRALERGDESGDLELVKLPREQSVLAAIQRVKRHPGVRFAEPNLIYKIQTTSNDSRYVDGSLWNMYGDNTSPANQYGSKAGDAWGAGRTGSTTVYIGVIDQGVQVEHPDLRQNAWTNSLDQPGDGIDNDGNGFVDDTFGWDFANGDNTVFDGNQTYGPDDHGTHVAGSITAVGGNATGVVGVTWRATFIPAKAIGTDGGTLANIIKAIDYITDLKVRHGVNIVATNNSWAGQALYSQALLDAIVRGAKSNILFIAAAENGGIDQRGDDNDLVPNYPSSYDTTLGAGYDAVISVASITSNGLLATSSNYGPTSVDLGAPGDSILSTVPTGTYGSKSGTSMATPHVTGAAALYASMYRTATPSLIKQAILNGATATPTASLNGNTLTGGILNVGLFGK